jgi:hypothetical protein
MKKFQNRKWFLHQRDAFFELGMTEITEVDPGNEITVFQCAYGVVFVCILESCNDRERQRWPDIMI